jgi:hypothetical protein
MLTLMLSWLGIQTGQLWAFLHFRDRQKQRDFLLAGKPRPREIPVVDPFLANYAGAPTKLDQVLTTTTVKGVRQLVNTRAFEHVVAGMINRNSHWHKHRNSKLLPTRICL